MNQDTIFDAAFENDIPPRRRDLMPKWLKIYMWLVIAAGFTKLIWVVLIAPNPHEVYGIGNDESITRVARITYMLSACASSVILICMGAFVFFERRRAILFNLTCASCWLTMILFNSSNNEAILITHLITFASFIPYWIGLFQIKRRWEMDAVRGATIS